MSGSPETTIVTVDGDDGRRRSVLTTTPQRGLEAILVLFHPYGFDPQAVLWGESPGPRLIRALPGVARAATSLRLAVVAPAGRGRAVDGGSLAWSAHLQAAATVAQRLMERTGCRQLVAAGLSQGGLEALVFAGRHQDVRAVAAVNPIVDLAAWHHDIVHRPIQVLSDMDVHDQISDEVGGLPDEVPHLYAERSVGTYVDQLAAIPVRLTWSPDDDVVADQATRHAGPLAERLRQAGGRVDEQILTHRQPAGAEPGRYAHESFDHWSTLGFLVDAVGAR